MPKLFRRISKSEIEPEEILLDKDSAGKLEIPIKKNGILVVFAVVILVFLVFWGRAFWLQIWRGDYYAARSAQNSVRIYQIRPPRGIIYDRNNKNLTENISNFNLLVVPADMPKDQRELLVWSKKLFEILKIDDSEISNFAKSLNKNSVEPILIAENLDRDILITIETQLPNLSGVFINKETKRTYIDGEYFSHLLGYLGKTSAKDIKINSQYSLLDFVGKNGIELQYENTLRGKSGKIAVSVTSDNTVLSTMVAEEPQIGNNLILNIDSDLQKLLTDALKNKMIETNSSGAAAVAMDVNTGGIISLVSLPNFNSNAFNSGISPSEYQSIVSNKAKPLFNRAVEGTYSSGSTIKPFIASAALAENTIDPNYQIDDTLGYITVPNQYNPDIIYTYRDWRAHGFVDMERAIAVSANVYFYEIGGGYKNIKGLGIEKIKKYLNLFGFGYDTGVDLPGESGGLIPDPNWKKTVKNEPWVTGDTYNVSIGQGDVLVTPLQMANAIAAIANGGLLWKPQILKKITDNGGKVLKTAEPELIRSGFVGDEKLKIVREGMRRAVTEGSVWFLNDLPFKVAGKTGTAQVTNTFKKTNAWFAGFAPYDKPEIAIAIVIEGAGEGSTAAVPVAKEVFNWYYENNNYDKAK